MNYLEQFPHYDDTLPTLEGFYDSSWHNDACPSLTKDLGGEKYLQVFCDYKDKELSDFADLVEGYARFSVFYQDHEQDLNAELLFESNNWADIEKFIKELNK
jgi:hypothetical protein